MKKRVEGIRDRIVTELQYKCFSGIFLLVMVKEKKEECVGEPFGGKKIKIKNQYHIRYDMYDLSQMIFYRKTKINVTS